MRRGDFPLRRDDLGKTWKEADDKQRAAWLRSGIVPLDYPDPVAADWPDLLAIVEQKVKPERIRKKPNGEFALRDPLPRRWWQYADKRPALYAALSLTPRALVIPQVTQWVNFTYMDSDIVFSHRLIVFPSAETSLFAVLQSSCHEAWARFYSYSLEERFAYGPRDCFETFPFPAGWVANAALGAAGREYYEFRAALMVRNNEGLTKTYNRFHDPEERSPDILKLRDLHAAMDAVVLTAYGWADLIPKCACEFLLDYDEEEDDETVGLGDYATGASSQSPQVSKSQRRRKKPWRYRWPDEIRDEVLARLLKLNAERAEEERLAGLAAKTTVRPGDSGTRRRKAAKSQSRQVAESSEASPQKDFFG